MSSHLFIFKPGSWLGEGTINLSMTREEFTFYTLWNIPKVNDKGRIACIQQIEMKGLPDHMHNQFSFYDVSLRNFSVKLESQSIREMVGRGIVNSKVISWEFRLGHLGFEGFELYQIGPNPETYLLHAEYMTGENFRVVVHGKIWKKDVVG